MFVQAWKIVEQQLIETLRRGQRADRIKGGMFGRVRGKAREPDSVAGQQMVQRPENRTKKRLAIRGECFGRQLAGGFVQSGVDPGVVGRHEMNRIGAAHGSRRSSPATGYALAASSRPRAG